MSKIVEDCRKFVEELLLPLDEKGYFYHNLMHTLDVFKRATYLSDAYDIVGEAKENIQLAALFHDTGFIFRYDNNEPFGVEISKKFLSKYDIRQERVFEIGRIIMATVISHEPVDLYEQIIRDADVDNLGRNDFAYKLGVLREETKEIKGVEFSDEQWFEIVYKFISGAKFHTQVQIKERNETKEKNKQILKNRLDKLLENK